MYRKIVLLALVSMLLLLSIVKQSTVQVKAQLNTIYVDASNIGDLLENGSLEHPFDKIQEGINAASSGETVFVYDGTYYERVNVNKTVSLVGEDRVAIVDGGGIGTVIKVTADNVNVTGFTIQNGGLLMADCGIFTVNCTGNTISNNIIRKNYNGLWLSASNSNSIVGNLIIDNSYAGMYISANNNSICSNTIAYNKVGAWIASSTMPNTFYHNNFIDNTDQAYDLGYSKWDNGTEGNYWSDFTGVDTDGDGVGEPQLPHLGLDSYPLIIPTKPFPVVWDDVIYPVALLGNSTVSGFYFSRPSKEIGFYVNGLLNKTGFCNVTIPKKLLWDSPWTVKADNNSIPFITTANTTHSSLYFTYNHSAQRIQIIGTGVIPEFPEAIFLPWFIIVTLVVAVLRKRAKRVSR